MKFLSFLRTSSIKKIFSEEMADRGLVQFVKYGFVGGLNFLFGVFCFYLLLHVVHLNYLLAFSITWALGTLLTYIINFMWIFKPEEKLNFKSRLIKYVIVYMLSFGINLLMLRLVTERTGYDPFLIQLGLIPIVIGINFMGMKYWSLK